MTVYMIIFGVLGTIFLAGTAICTVALWPSGNPFSAAGGSGEDHRNFEIGNGVVFHQNFPSRSQRFEMPDGGHIAARLVGPEQASDIIVMIHGIGAAGERWNNPSGLMSMATGAQVVALDLRGHHESSGRRYDLDRIGQYEDDIAQVIAELRASRPDARIWLAGHSMGGGIALRFALKKDRPQVAGYLMFAPVFGPGPTAPHVLPAEAIMRIDRRRMSVLITLNMLGIRRFNSLPVAYLNVPPDFPAYSFRAISSGLPLPPNTAEEALDTMESPFIIIAGEDDEVVRVEGYHEIAGCKSRGTIEIVPRHGHDSLLNDPEVHLIVANWMKRVAPQFSSHAMPPATPLGDSKRSD